MARRKAKRKGSRKQKPSIVSALAFVPGAHYSYVGYTQKGLEGAATHALHGFTGYNANTNKFEMEGLKRGLIPAAGILAISMVGKKMGLNRYVPKWIPIKLF